MTTARELIDKHFSLSLNEKAMSPDQKQSWLKKASGKELMEMYRSLTKARVPSGSDKDYDDYKMLNSELMKRLK